MPTLTEGNESAVKWYGSVGFRTFGTERMAIHTPSGLEAKFHMWLPLAPGADARQPIA